MYSATSERALTSRTAASGVPYLRFAPFSCPCDLSWQIRNRSTHRMARWRRSSSPIPSRPSRPPNTGQR